MGGAGELVTNGSGISAGRMTHGSVTKATVDSSVPMTPPKTRRNYHILLVEDNLINQKVLSKQLRSVGCVVHVANHGKSITPRCGESPIPGSSGSWHIPVPCLRIYNTEPV
jgi:hypothetical protein